MKKFKPPKGMRDLLPDEMILRQSVVEKIRKVFEVFGFQPLETPAIERWDVLAAKGAGGEEILKESYSFKDKGGRKVGLRYDLTVPLARVVSSNLSLPLPFKRYQIEKVWRYGDVTKGRLREFLQCDIDIVGSKSMLADAEVIACAIKCLDSLNLKNFIVRLNNRKILSALIKFAGVKKSKVIDVLRSIDKLDKIGIDGVKKELTEKKLSRDSIGRIIKLIKVDGKPKRVLKRVYELVKEFDEGREGVKELEEVIFYLKQMGVDSRVKIDLSLARGLDYYTGPIFEISTDKEIGSIAGGGRYDKLIGLFGGRELSATGISLGIERIIELIKEMKIGEERKSKTKVFVAAATDEVRDVVLKIVQKLRDAGIPADLDLRGRKLTRQLEYADLLCIPYVVIVGEKELRKNVVKLRDMKKREETEVKIEDLIRKIA